MDYDLNDYDPFHPMVLYEIGYWGDIYTEIDSEPMTDDDWKEWLTND